MKKTALFSYSIKGAGRPQILLIGNGLELGCEPTVPDPKGVKAQLSWDELVAAISVDGCAKMPESEEEKLPFPLRYSLLSVPEPAPSITDSKMLNDEENRLKSAMKRLSQNSNSRLDTLKTLGADHIFTTNYSYGLEQSFFPGKDFFSTKVRSSHRFNLNPQTKNGQPAREVSYRLHTGYLAQNSDGSKVGLWHIHGECSISRGVVLGHDRYGRLLSRIEKLCDSQNYYAISKKRGKVAFNSWPELFLYGDVYVVGFGFNLSEFDLWWLMKRKQRERMGTGRVYFYEHPDPASLTQKMMRAHGAELPDVGAKPGDYNDLYMNAFTDIAKRIAENKAKAEQPGKSPGSSQGNL